MHDRCGHLASAAGSGHPNEGAVCPVRGIFATPGGAMPLNATMSLERRLLAALPAVLAALALAGTPAHAAVDPSGPREDSAPAGWTWRADAGTWVFEVRSPALRLASDRVQEVATTTLGRPVEVFCADRERHWPAILASIPGLSDRAIAFAWFGTGPVVLSTGVCSQLERVARHRGNRWDGIRSVAILAHELGHVAGHVDEHVADCWGAGRSKRLARALALDRPAALRHEVIRYLDLTRANDCRKRLLRSAVVPRSR